ncbi:SpoIVB peptidase [Acetivibrio clariflavus]|uniref:Stage IV sporulation protein B n=1 Tax=Acetivibrio clariflavus (strain DSM 19732 / NBRC 101661 / EBR45) TaxID=720554 RepID=G8LW28_ACECE|nr:SpoIVB peptidase [Acetivibrio clariflavus]AEV68632.1 stage IV sporulation protein B [Acetivibrio clariflavus DSM 19732]
MKYIKSTKRKLGLFIAVCFAVMAITYIRAIYDLPNQLTLFENQENVYHLDSPFLVDIQADKSDIVKLENNKSKKKSLVRLINPVLIKPQRMGTVNISMRILGLIPIKTVQVDVVPYREVVACGNTVGVKLKIEGILVVGMSDIETFEGKKMLPAKDAGIKPGDLIIEANGKPVDSIEALISEIDNSNGQEMKLKLKRDKRTEVITVKPIKSVEDNKYHLGMWVRDSTAGIGTLTFYDPKNNAFGALGHGITDVDTGALMPVENGEIVESNILTIVKGRAGSPGELKGVLIEERKELGIIKKNSPYGIYGVLNKDMLYKFPDKLYPVGLRDEVELGKASILSNIDGKTVDEYEIEIQKISKKPSNKQKGMVIKIKDSELLEKTGGIVQGMSGSPIIQNGKLIGAVTHVLVNDPTRGYGIFIENMLKNTVDEPKYSLNEAS